MRTDRLVAQESAQIVGQRLGALVAPMRLINQTLLQDVVQIPAQIWADIVKRPYVTIGMTAFVLMIPLALTSNAWSIRKLGPAWRRLHKLTYAVALMGGVHYLMLVKGWQIEPMLYLAGIAALLLMRLRVSAALGATAARARSV